MARGVPTFLFQKARKKAVPAKQRTTRLQRDPNKPDNDCTPDKVVEAAPAPVVEKKAAPAPAPAPEPTPEPVEETAALSMDNTKAELLAAAEEMGLDVDATMKKADILAAIESA